MVLDAVDLKDGAQFTPEEVDEEPASVGKIDAR
ncbi:MAG: hypothetical protein QOJ18_551, partial [Microbacteriaceae bacterium]|nr:hypothetical protein [Microbacteriaceae bacterium]